jgi:hypothetical protein
MKKLITVIDPMTDDIYKEAIEIIKKDYPEIDTATISTFVYEGSTVFYGEEGK